MKSLFKFAGVALFLCAPLLRADSVRFDLNDSVNDFSFTLPSQPTPDQSGEDFEHIPFFIFNNIPVTVNGVTTNQGVLFADSGDQHLVLADEFHVSAADQVVSDHNILVSFLRRGQEYILRNCRESYVHRGVAEWFSVRVRSPANGHAVY